MQWDSNLAALLSNQMLVQPSKEKDNNIEWVFRFPVYYNNETYKQNPNHESQRDGQTETRVTCCIDAASELCAGLLGLFNPQQRIV
jgi:hypothetical protein